MGQINLHNYEACFLDYMEGNLSKEQECELQGFLSCHPELKNDLKDNFSVIELTPEETSFDNNFLKKEGIQADEVEDLMITFIEGELNEGDEQELALYVQRNGLQKTFSYYRNTILVPLEDETYSDKEELKKREGMVVNLFRVAVAATVVVAFFAGINNAMDDNGSSLGMESTEVRSPIQVDPKVNLPRINSESGNKSIERETRIDLQHDPLNNGNLVEKNQLPMEGNSANDSLKNHPNEELPQVIIPDGIVQIEASKNKVQNIELESDDIILVDTGQDQIITEEPIKLITNVAGSIFKRDISYQRDKKKYSEDYVAHHFKLGRFEFNRKKH